MWGSWQPSFSYPNRSSSPVQLHAVALVESARNLTPQSHSRISQFIIVYHRIFHRGNHVTATNRREGALKQSFHLSVLLVDPRGGLFGLQPSVMIHGWFMGFPYKIFPLGHPCCHFRLMDFLFPKLCMLQLLKSHVQSACQGWIWRKYTFQSEDLRVKLWLLCSFWIPAKFGHWHWTPASKTTHRHLWTSLLRSRPLPANYVLSWLLADVPPISKPLKPDVEASKNSMECAACSMIDCRTCYMLTCR